MNDAGIKLLAAVIGFWIIMRAVSRDAGGRTLIDHILGQSGGANQALPPGAASNPLGTPNARGQVNPVPGATGSRLDQGFDLTSKTFVSPYAGKVVSSTPNSPGWMGGGYVAIANLLNPKQVTYFAEGILPAVSQGETVQAGQTIGVPAINPYNAIPGNIEIGPANPAAPTQPLAQVVSNPAAAVRSFYNWLKTLGGPTASSTSQAGSA
ncbi:MAG TPA: hypothetical protein VG325_17680 [Solirubrobacteraceae bacterium]|jgi:hypothetical protein|nr:hypothetical protein [Solirubrobacteraceae bacterium]